MRISEIYDNVKSESIVAIFHGNIALQSVKQKRFSCFRVKNLPILILQTNRDVKGRVIKSIFLRE